MTDVEGVELLETEPGEAQMDLEIEEAEEEAAEAADDFEHHRHHTVGLSLGGYEPDAGPRGQPPFLSLAKALRKAELGHPGISQEVLVDGQRHIKRRKYPLGVRVGRHHLTDAKQASSRDQAFSQFGVGVVLYFKALKYLVWLFALLTALSVPALVFYTQGGTISSEEMAFYVSEAPVESLVWFTIGALGEGDVVCTSEDEGSSFDLLCPDGSVIGDVDLFYGNVNGTCGCPASQKVDESGNCPGDLNRATTPTTCTKDEEGSYEACFIGEDPLYGDDCCSVSRDDDGYADFSDLEIVDEPTCYSTTASVIGRGMCLGQSNCSFVADADFVYSWTPDAYYDTVCSDGDDVGPCEETLGGDDNGEWGGCHDDEMRLVAVARCYDTEVSINGKIYEKEKVVRVVSALDVVATLAFLVGVRVLRRKEHQDTLRITAHVVTPRTYSIQVSGLPPHDDVDHLASELTEHFEALAASEEKIYKDLEKTKVADINFGMNNSAHIKLAKARGKVAKKLDFVRAKMERMHQVTQSSSAEEVEKRVFLLKEQAREEMLSRRLALIEARLDVVEREVKGRPVQARTAFITFEEEEACLRVLRAYPNRIMGLNLFFRQPERLRLRGAELRVKRAPEPSDVMYENLECSLLNQVARQLATSVFSFALLFLSFYLIWLAKVENDRADRLYPSVDCSVYDVDTSDSAVDLDDVNHLTYHDVLRDVEYAYYNQTAGLTGKLECFCLALSDEEGVASMIQHTFLNPTNGEEERWCWDWTLAWLSVQSSTAFAVVGVLFINTALKRVLRKIADYEGHKSRAGMVTSVTLKIFVAQLINTGFIVLLVNGNDEFFSSSAAADSSSTDSSDTLAFFNGEHDDFDEAWYREIGTSIQFTMLLNIFLPHASPLFFIMLRTFRRLYDRRFGCDRHVTNKFTQLELEKLYTGPKFLLADRYAQAFTTVFVCLCYSSGMPLLMPIACLSFIVSFAVDKVLFLRSVRTPPSYSSRVAETVAPLLPFAALLHLATGLWMYSNPAIFEASQSSADFQLGNSTSSALDIVTSLDSTTGTVLERVSQSSTILMFVLFVGLFFYFTLYKFVYKGVVGGSAKAIFNLCCAQLKCFHRAVSYLLMDELVIIDPPNYFDALPEQKIVERLRLGQCKDSIKPKLERALKRKRMRRQESGMSVHQATLQSRRIIMLETYDLSANPEYQEQFGYDSSAGSLKLQNLRRQSIDDSSRSVLAGAAADPSVSLV